MISIESTKTVHTIERRIRVKGGEPLDESDNRPFLVTLRWRLDEAKETWEITRIKVKTRTIEGQRSYSMYYSLGSEMPNWLHTLIQHQWPQ